MKQYHELVQHILDNGTRKENRTGVDTISTFGYYFEHDLREGFPLLTTKNISWKNIVVEMLWFLSGQQDISILKRHGCKFWDAWADSNGKVPSAYGNFWRRFPVHGVRDSSDHTIDGDECCAYNDQIKWVLGELRRNPMSRRMVVSAWAPGNAQYSKLPPCHSIFMLNVQNEEGPVPAVAMFDAQGNQVRQHGLPSPRLCLHLTQRSCDTALGVPYNIASYALLLSIFSHLSGIEPGIFGHTLVDAHIYTAKPDGSMAEYDHIPGLKEQITREPLPLPKLMISDSIKELADIERLMKPEVSTDEVMEHFRLGGYDPYPAIPFKVAV
jgi:thymidylate synthase